MARSIWKGSISFGLVNIPVGLYSAETRDEVHFHLLDKKNMSPIRYKRVSEKTGKEVAWEDIVRGYEYEEGRYVVLSDEDLKRANPEATQTVDIVDFVDGEEISPVYYDKPYYLAPLKNGAKGYALLRETLKRTGKVGIAKVVIRTRQYLAAVVPEGNVMVLNLLRFAHELRNAEDLDLPSGKAGVSDREIDMAEKLVEGMVGEWDPEQYRDEYQDDLMAMIERRVKTGETEEAPVPPPAAETGKVIDLMALLRQSVEMSGKGGSGARSAQASKPAAKSKAAKTGKTTKKPAAKKPAAKPAARRRKTA